MNFATFPLHVPFARALAEYLLAEHGQTAESLSRVTLLLPSRRACLAMRAALMEAAGKNLLLPRMQPLGDVEEDALAAESWIAGEVPEALPKQRVMPALEREMLLAKLVAAYPQPTPLPMVAVMGLARALAQWMDDVARHELKVAQLHNLVPEELSAHWQQTLQFLSIVTQQWPQLLQEQQAQSPIERRNALLHALARHWQAHPPAHPVIAAGSTGSQAATAALLKVIAAKGQVILPGLDVGMPEAAWEQVEASHPQYLLKQLLDYAGVERHKVTLLGEGKSASLITRAMLPAGMLHTWREEKLTAETLQHVRWVEAETPQQEAQAIVQLLGAEQSVMIVTPDRRLARCLKAEAAQHGLMLDDSEGVTLAQTAPAHFLMLVAEFATQPKAVVPLLALLKHPLCAGGGLSRAAWLEGARQLEIGLLRGVSPHLALDALAARCRSKNLPQAAKMLDVLHSRVKPLHATSDLHTLLHALTETAEALAGEALWKGEAGQALAEYMHELLAHARLLGHVRGRDVPELLRGWLEGVTVRQAYGVQPGLRILSPAEARMQQAELVILAGMSEGVWPQLPAPSPWMSRPMQQQFGLPAPEQAIGQMAHDFLQLVSQAPRLVLSRHKKVEGAVLPPSRFWLRLRFCALAGGLQVEVETPHFAHPTALSVDWQPPCPPLSARPSEISVTDMEHYFNDPYTIYAKYILQLKPLEPLEKEPGAAEFGNAVHQVMRRFAERFPAELPADAEAALLACATEILQKDDAAYWQPRFAAAVPWIIAQEREARSAGGKVMAEIKGKLTHAGLTLKTRIDRLGFKADNSAVIVDYKTGDPPSGKKVKELDKPQLPLEAAVAVLGEMEGAPRPASISALEYWAIRGEKSKATTIDAEPHTLMDKALERVAQCAEEFRDLQMAYTIEPRGEAPSFDTYAHLKRKESA